ncbi:hypothetical protein GCM10017687_65460 [Streptomyces echinatus]
MTDPHELRVLNPATEEVVATVPAASEEDVAAAVVRAVRAQRTWAAVAPADRARLLRRFADAVDAHTEELAQLEVREAGHTVGNARWEAGNARDLLLYAAGGAERLLGSQIPAPGGWNVTFQEPLGVIGVIAPWNFPMPIAAWGSFPALAAGNAVVLKPAETTPLTALRLAELALDAGLPEHLFQVLPGYGATAGRALVDHPDVAKIVFTGSTRTGREVMERCARLVKPVTLELGGKSPNIVFADADLEAALDPFSFLDNSGQDCCARTRILVQEPVFEQARDFLADALAAVVVGDPADEKTRMGPLISRQQLDRVRSYVPEDAPRPARHRPRRARLLVPADRPHRGTAGRPGGHRGDLRPGRRPPALHRRAGRRPSRRRHPLRSLRLHLDPGRGPRPARLAGRPRGQPVRQLPLQRPLLDPVRRLQAVRPRPRTRPRRPDRLHPDQERLHQHGGPRTVTDNIVCRRLAGRTAVVTGAGSGIGLATARRLASEGAHVVCADVDETRGKAAADEVGGLFVKVDVTDPEQVEALFKAAHDTYGSVDIAFNNAGISPPDDDSILETGLEAWKRVQEVNLTSVYLCCKAAIPYMRRQGKGSIINTASFVARMGAATSQISYTASKGGVLAMSRELGVQFAREGIRVNALCPGPVNTPLLQELFAKDPERAARRLVHIPVGRFAEAEEIAAAVAFLASDDSSFVNATDFLVDGGIAGAYVTPL